MVYITIMMMEEYKRRMHNDNNLRLVPPSIPAATRFELKGHILSMLKDIPFSRKDHEDEFRHINEVLDIVNYFNVQNVSRDTLLLRILQVTFMGDVG